MGDMEMKDEGLMKKKNQSGNGDNLELKENPETVVLKIEMHCEGCARKISRVARRFKGVESVKAEAHADKLTVVGKVDAPKLRKRLADRTKRNVEILSPKPNMEKDDDDENADDSKKPKKGNEDKEPEEATFAEWIFLITSLGLEILSAACDHASSPSKPQYALFGMLLAIAATLSCILELIHKGIKERVVLRRWGMLWWFYYPPPCYLPFATFPDNYGLLGAICQCVFSTVQYVYFHHHADNPIKMSILPAIYVICLGSSRLAKNRRYTSNGAIEHSAWTKKMVL